MVLFLESGWAGSAMIEIDHLRETDLCADALWRELRHFDRVLNWIPGGDESTITVQGEGVGAVRDLLLATQGHVRHRLVALDEERRRLSYELIAGKPIGMKDYVVVATVTPIDEERCTICWSGRMTAEASLDEEGVGRALEVALGNMTTGLIARLKGEVPIFSPQPNEDWQLRNTGEDAAGKA